MGFIYEAWYSGVAPIIGLVLFLFALAFVVAGCKPAQQPDKFPAYCYSEVQFTQELVRCATTAPDKPASRACRAEVHRACGITMTVSERSVAP